jgi:hypothetical protein
MPADSDPIMPARSPDDLVSIILDITSQIQFKFLGFLVIVFILLSSDIFINRVLAKFKGAVDYKTPTSWGVCLQSMFLAMIMLVLDGLIRQKII